MLSNKSQLLSCLHLTRCLCVKTFPNFFRVLPPLLLDHITCMIQILFLLNSSDTPHLLHIPLTTLLGLSTFKITVYRLLQHHLRGISLNSFWRLKEQLSDIFVIGITRVHVLDSTKDFYTQLVPFIFSKQICTFMTFYFILV